MSVVINGETFQILSDDEDDDANNSLPVQTAPLSKKEGKRVAPPPPSTDEAVNTKKLKSTDAKIVLKAIKSKSVQHEDNTKKDVETLVAMFNHIRRKNAQTEYTQSVIQYKGFEIPSSSITKVVSECENDTVIEIKKIHKHMAQDHAKSVGFPVGFEVHTNYQSATLEFASRNVHALVSNIVCQTTHVRLTAQQRLAAAMMVTAVDCDVTCDVRHKISDPQPNSIVPENYSLGFARLQSHSLPNFRFCNFPTGVGKTLIATAALMYALCDDSKWNEIVKMYEFRRKASSFNCSNGFTIVQNENVFERKLARVALCFVPEDTISQWVATLHSVEAEARKLYGNAVRIWDGSKKKHKGQRSLAVAESDGIPTIWVLPEQVRGRYAELDCVDTHDYALRVYDEVTPKHGTRSRPNTSQPVLNLLINATISHLKSVCNISNHPLKDYMHGHWKSMYDVHDSQFSRWCLSERKQAAVNFMAVMLASPPEWLRSQVMKEAIKFMPPGIHLHRLKLRKVNLQTSLYGTDLIAMSVSGMLSAQLGGCYGTYCDEMRTGLMSIVNANGGNGTTLVQKTIDAIEKWVTEHDALWFDNLLARYLESNPSSYARPNVSSERSLIGRVSAFLEKAKSVIDPEAEVEDPVTLDNIPPDRRIILDCCFNIADSDVIKEIRARWYNDYGNWRNPKCPLCRGDLSSAKTVSAAKADQPGSSSDPIQDPETVEDFIGDDSSFFKSMPSTERVAKAIQLFREKKNDSPPGTLKGLGLLLCLCCKAKSNLRALVIVKVEREYEQGNREKQAMLSEFKTYLPSNASVNLVLGNTKTTDACIQYKNSRNKNPHILFLVSADSNRTNVAGIDLPNTDMTVFETSRSMDSNIVQAMGRSLRMQTVRSKTQANKHIVVID